VQRWQELGAGVFARRYEPWDVTVSVVLGAKGVLVVDTRASHRQADDLLGDLRRLDPRPPRWVVNTHWHFDHTYGNARFLPAELWSHETVPAALHRCVQATQAGARPSDEVPADAEYAEVVITPPDHLVKERAVLDLGGRVVELVHLGRGHTDGDLVVVVPDAGVVFAGDLVEESGPPSYGDDSFPLEWPVTAGRLLALLGEGDKVVPGHGAVVDRSFVADQQKALAAVARRHRRSR
jgi:glyoxylase-like metal-dependent hydrolase (beta-lactamase superfamily II)